jgi:hypothetical protein
MSDDFSSDFANKESGVGSAAKARVPARLTQVETDAAFAQWWARYPRKEAKLAAKKIYVAIVTGKHRDPEARATPEQLLAALNAYKFPSDPQFIKHPATWLNSGSWADFASRELEGADKMQALQQHADVLARLREEEDTGAWR